MQIADAVVIARYLGATLVLPEVRGNELGKSRYVSDAILVSSIRYGFTPAGGENMSFAPHEHLERHQQSLKRQ